MGSAALGRGGSAEVHPYAPRPPALERVAAARAALAATGACLSPEQARLVSASAFPRRLSVWSVCAPLKLAAAGRASGLDTLEMRGQRLANVFF